MEKLTCGFIGLGLIGGSMAKALREKKGDQIQILAYDIQPDTLQQALVQGVIDVALADIDSTISGCDYLFLCAPVSNNDENLEKIARFLSPRTILTDVGSVKSPIHQEISRLGLNAQFIGGHPMAGSERTGFANAKALLLENAYYILTPTEEVSADKVAAYENLVRLMGAIPLLLTAAQHDYVTAAVSHLPHVIAASLVNLVQNSDSADGIMKTIAAGGFKDITRIASSSPDMWQQICLTNRENICLLLSDYIRSLEQIQEDLLTHSSSPLYDLFNQARTYRDSFSDVSSGPIKKVFVLTVDIADEPGALASIATMLALHQISIKNIGIVHNREYEEGVLRIAFYDEEAVLCARQLLLSKGYVIHDRKK